MTATASDVPFLFVDVETDTTDAAHAHLLEVGFAVVTPDLRDVTARASWVVPYAPATLDTIRRQAAPVVLQAPAVYAAPAALRSPRWIAGWFIALAFLIAAATAAVEAIVGGSPMPFAPRTMSAE